MIRSRCSLVVLVLGLAACSGGDGGGGGGGGGSGGSAGGNSGGTGGGGPGGGSAGTGGSAMAGAGGSSSAGSGAGTSGGGSGGGSAGAAGGAAGAGGSSSAGTGGSSSAGAGGSSSGGRGGSAGAAGGSAGGGSGGTASGGRGGAGGGTATMATATIMPLGANTVTGTATFSVNPQGLLSLQINLTNCPPGGHAAHLHEFANCGSNGNDAGNHWVPKGEIIQTITCAADGTASSTTIATPPNTWTIGGDASSNVLPHAIMIHASPDPSAGARIGCGVAAATP